MRSAGHIFMVLAALALAAAITYGLIAQELAGAVMLGVFSVALVYIATVLANAGPYDRAENEPDAEPDLGPEHHLGASWWPLVMAVGAGVALLGLKFNIVIMALGFGIFLSAVVGWFVQAGRQAAAHARHAAEGATHGETTH